MSVSKHVFDAISGVLSFFYHLICITRLGAVGASNTRQSVIRTYAEHKGFSSTAKCIAIQYGRLFGGLAIIVSIFIGFGVGRASERYGAGRHDSRPNDGVVSGADGVSAAAQYKSDRSIEDIRDEIGEVREASELATTDASRAGFFYIDEYGQLCLQIDKRKFRVIEIAEP